MHLEEFDVQVPRSERETSNFGTFWAQKVEKIAEDGV